jgi:hypothetical protein
MNENNKTQSITIDIDKIVLRFSETDSIVIPRRTLRTRLQLIEWVYRLTNWPRMNLVRMRAFIAAIFRHHGWALPYEHPDTDDAEATPTYDLSKQTQRKAA